MKFNKVLNDVNVSFETKRYVNNYINESIKLMNESGKIEEFIQQNNELAEKTATE